MGEVWSIPLTSSESILKGLVAGFLIGAGVFGQAFGIVIQIVLVALGALVFLDAIIPASKSVHGFTVLIFAVVGGLAAFLLTITGNAFIFVIIAVIIAVLIYLRKVMTGLHVLSK
jgi:hypothetical protein